MLHDWRFFVFNVCFSLPLINNLSKKSFFLSFAFAFIRLEIEMKYLKIENPFLKHRLQYFQFGSERKFFRIFVWFGCLRGYSEDFCLLSGLIFSKCFFFVLLVVPVLPLLLQY